MVRLDKCNRALRVLYGKPFPRKRMGIFKVLGKGKGPTVAKQKKE
jgi:hypothetical protein